MLEAKRDILGRRFYHDVEFCLEESGQECMVAKCFESFDTVVDNIMFSEKIMGLDVDSDDVKLAGDPQK